MSGITPGVLPRNVAAGATKLYFAFFVMAALIYLLLTIISMLLLTRIERYAGRGVRRAV